MYRTIVSCLLGGMFTVSSYSIAGAETLTLSQALSKAEKESPQLQAAKAKVEAFAGESQQAAAWLNPEFEFEVENFEGSGQFKGTSVAEYTYALTQKLEIGGKRGARSDAALKRLKAAQAGYTVAEQQLKQNVTTTYMATVAAAQNLKLAEEQERLAQTVLNTVTKRVKAAREPEIQQSKAEVAYATVTLKRQQAERDVQVARTDLANLWGDNLLGEMLQSDTFFIITEPKGLQIYEEQLINAPKLKRYQFLTRAQKAEANFERAQNVPDPTFRLGVKEFNESGEQALLAGFSFPLPVFNRNGGNIRKALSEVTEAEQQENQARLTLAQQLRKGWQNWQQGAQESKRLQSSIIPAAKKAFKLAREGYEKGRFPYLEVLDAQRTLFEARAQYHDALLRMHTARAEVVSLTQNTPTEFKEHNNETNK